MSRILVLGKNGQLGKSIQKIILNNNIKTDEFTFLGREDLNLCDAKRVDNYFSVNSFDLIINCAAYTQVDKAEIDIKIANQINNLAVAQISNIAKAQKAKLIHISTDYVFDGQKNSAYKEIDITNPINFYGKTKLDGEIMIQKILPNDAIIIRVGWLYSEYGKNFIKTILKLAKEQKELNIVNDQIGSPTFATDLANIILNPIKNKMLKKSNQKTQIYHYSNQGKVSWYMLAKKALELAKINCKINPINSDFYTTLAKRPKNTLMDKSKISSTFNLNIIDFEKSLKVCILSLK